MVQFIVSIWVMGLEQLILEGAKSMETPEKGKTSELDPERNQKLQSCDFLSTLMFFPLGNSCAAHLMILRLAVVIAGDWFVISAHIAETFKPFL